MSNARTDAEIKSLKSRIGRLKAETDAALESLSCVQLEYETKFRALQELLQRLKALEENKSADVVISEHAYLQWFIRVTGHSLEEVARTMLSDRTREAIERLGTVDVHLPEHKVKLIVKQRTVVTVVPE